MANLIISEEAETGETDMKTFVELATTIRDGPSTLTFRAIRGLIDTWTDKNTITKAIEWVNSEINIWPNYSCHVECLPEQLSAIVDSPSWSLVRSLNIRGEINLDTSNALKQFHRLKRLSFELNEPRTGRLDILHDLSELSIWIGPKFTPSMLKEYLAEELPPSVNELEFSVIMDLGHWTEIRSFLASRKTSSLASLNLIGVAPGFLESTIPVLPDSLRAFSCQVAGIADPDVNALLSSPFCPQLESVTLSSSDLTDEQVGMLGRSDRLKSLRKLNLCGNKIGRDGAVAIAHASWIESISDLCLSNNRLGDDGCKSILQAPLGRLKHLALSETSCGSNAAKNLATNASLGSLRKLELSGNKLNDQDARALFSTAHLQDLQKLRIDYNRFTSDAIDWISNSPLQLTDLDISGIQLPSKKINGLVKDRSFRVLQVAHCSLGSEGVKELVESIGPGLRVLDVAWNQLGDDGMKYIAHSAKLCTLWLLRCAEITFEGYFHTEGLSELARSNYLMPVDLTVVGIRDSESAIEGLSSWIGLQRLDRLELEKPGYGALRQLEQFRPETRAFILHCRENGCPF